MQKTQVIGEKLWYVQKLKGTDTISQVTWAVLPAGPTLENVTNDIDGTLSKVLFGSTSIGLFRLTCTLTLTSGQIVVGEGVISVVTERT